MPPLLEPVSPYISVTVTTIISPPLRGSWLTYRRCTKTWLASSHATSHQRHLVDTWSLTLRSSCRAMWESMCFPAICTTTAELRWICVGLSWVWRNAGRRTWTSCQRHGNRFTRKSLRKWRDRFTCDARFQVGTGSHLYMLFFAFGNLYIHAIFL